jgi:TatD DNase family protein
VIDFHCHLDLYRDPAAVLARATAAGVGVLSVTTTPTAWSGTSRLAEGSSLVRTAAGLHPELAHRRLHELPELVDLIGQTRFVGEVGLDGQTRSSEERAAQTTVLEAVFAAAATHGGRVVSIHSRRAVTPVLERIEQHSGRFAAVLHWFSGSERQLHRATEAGCWFSVNEQMLRSEKGRALAAKMPPGRVLIETDGPFASDGVGPLEPADIHRAASMLASIWDVSPESAIELVDLNERALLR